MHGLIHRRFYVNVPVVNTRKTGYISRLVGCGSMDMNNSLNSLLALSKMYRIIGFELVCVFRQFYANTSTSGKVSVLILRFFLPARRYASAGNSDRNV